MKWSFVIVSVVGLATLAGCGPSLPPRAHVSGTVTVAGKGPLTGGGIIFYSVADPKLSGSGPIKADGTYDVAEAPVGECKVTISNSDLKGAPAASPPPSAAAPGGKIGTAPPGVDISGMGGPAAAKVYMPIDASFESPTSTTLKATVTRGDNKFDFEVK